MNPNGPMRPRRPRGARAPWTSLSIALVLAAPLSPAGAHEERRVAAYQLEIGWETEPPLAGEMNAITATVRADAREAVRNARLSVVVSFGATASGEMRLEPVAGEAGTYRAPLLPTRAGTYSLQVSGRIGSTRVDERFEGGDDAFEDVRDADEAQFPPGDPSRGELAERVERLDRRVAAARASAESSGGGARLLAIVSLVVAALALIVAALSLSAARRARAQIPG